MIKSIIRISILMGLLFTASLVFAESAKWQSPETVQGTETVNLEQVKSLHTSGVKFIDVRSTRQYKKRHIPGAIHLYIKDTFNESNLLKHVKKDEPFVIYCNGTHCSLSYKAAEKAVAWGFTGIKYFREGIRAWRLDGNPLEYGNNQDSSG